MNAWMHALRARLGGIAFGGDYNPEQWDRPVRQPAYPGAFRGPIGAYIDEYWPARDGETFEVTFADGSANEGR